ncbi:MAG: family 43 glycosylhydrolase [Calditrichaeota bacterium]|nr:family 43 glycosylhydrolase [Calditrichota bacterium]
MPGETRSSIRRSTVWGVATAPTPLGPWTRHNQNPILDYGPDGSWDDNSVDCVSVMKEGAFDLKAGTEKYYLWYSGRNTDGSRHIGLATASSPLGPWQKYEGNPILLRVRLHRRCNKGGRQVLYIRTESRRRHRSGPFLCSHR